MQQSFYRAFWGQVLKGTCTYGAPMGTGPKGACLSCAFRGQVLIGTCLSCSFADQSLREPRSRFPGACGGRDLSDLACLPAASLFKGLAPARVTERVRLPLVIRPGVDKPVHGQRISITIGSLILITCTALTHTPAVNVVNFKQGCSGQAKL